MKKLRTILTAGVLVILSLSLGSCYFGVSGNGNVQEKQVDVAGFSRLVIDGNFDVFLRQGNEPGLRIEADENLHELIRVKNSGSYLHIDTREHILRAKKKSLYLTYTDLEKMELNGAIDLKTESPITVPSLSVFVSGAADLQMNLKAEKIWLEISGAADCDLSGRVKKLDMDLSGAGDLNAIELESEEASVTMSGAGTAKVWAQKELYVEISGAGTVRYKGDPRISKSISGIGSLKRY